MGCILFGANVAKLFLLTKSCMKDQKNLTGWLIGGVFVVAVGVWGMTYIFGFGPTPLDINLQKGSTTTLPVAELGDVNTPIQHLSQSLPLTDLGVLQMVNAQRQAAGLTQLDGDRLLDIAAHYKANEMLRLGYFSVEGSGGTSADDLILAAGYKTSYAIEFVSKSDTTADDAIARAMGTVAGKTAILTDRATLMGAAVEGDIVVVILAGPDENRDQQ